jgi:hypothetical protein
MPLVPITPRPSAGIIVLGVVLELFGLIVFAMMIFVFFDLDWLIR